VDVLDRILDKGLVVVGDIKISLADVELLTLKIRLLVCSVDKAEQIGINWWRFDPDLSVANGSGGGAAAVKRLKPSSSPDDLHGVNSIPGLAAETDGQTGPTRGKAGPAGRKNGAALLDDCG